MKCDFCWRNNANVEKYEEKTPSGFLLRYYKCDVCKTKEPKDLEQPVFISTRQAQHITRNFCEIYNVFVGHSPSSADVDHSAVLSRMLGGEDPLAVPPPRAFSYPYYELGECKECPIGEISEYRYSTGLEGLAINQCGAWERTDDPSVIRYRETGQLFRLSKPLDEVLAEYKEAVKTVGAFPNIPVTIQLIADQFPRVKTIWF